MAEKTRRQSALAFMGMVTVMLAMAASMVVNKGALSKGMSKIILLVYSKALSGLILLPSIFIPHRADKPPLDFSVLCRIFLLALTGTLGSIPGYAGIKYSSPLLRSALRNLVPTLTFILAIIFRMESLDGSRWSTRAKLIGSIVSIAGAFVVTFYKGPPILLPRWSLFHQLLSQKSNWVLGGLCFSVESLGISVSDIFQGCILKLYPETRATVCPYCFFVALQAAIVSLFTEDPSSWLIRPDIRLTAVLYNGAVGAVLRTALGSWCLKRTGPLYHAMLKLLANLFAFVLGVIFFGDVLYLGSVVGAIIILAGFYSVMWGKAKEKETCKCHPLLQNEVERLDPLEEEEDIPLIPDI
ncbi:hypothetical protein NMG60_11008995 [Bertholletia excelsa]